ncbi:MAG TPA: hypothetical protein VIN09_03925 [Chloroflexota bacterium]
MRYVNLLLLACVGLAVAAGFALDRRGGPADPEVPLRTYFAALERRDLDQALDQVVPEIRASVRATVANQLGHRHVLRGIGVRGPSLLDALTAPDPAGPPRRFATAILEITNHRGDRWIATARSSLHWNGERWLLEQVPVE